jgi:ferrous iron transport protein B
VTAPLVVLVGNPNTGKSTLFNRLTGANARVGNYPGVTVELQRGTLDLGAPTGPVEVLDVPGCYSLVSRSREEQVAIECLLGLGGDPAPSLVVCCVDATNLSRNLYFVLQLQELGLNLVLALTMIDEAGPRVPEPRELGRILGCPVVGVVARTGQGLDELRRTVSERLRLTAGESRFRFTPSARLADQIARVRAACAEARGDARGQPSERLDSDAFALWALMSVSAQDELTLPASIRDAVRAAVPDEESGKALDDEVIQGRYAFIDAEVTPLVAPPAGRSLTERVDAVLIHPVFGFVTFLGIALVLFQSLFSWANPAIDAISWLLEKLGDRVHALLGDNLLSELIVEGVIGGTGNVVVFLPQILLLFLFVGLMEDSGYMARVAYLMDRIMKSMGLHGRAFVPMLSGFACAIPAIMATRTMERQRDRLLTMLVIPLMTCSARLPVYTLIIGALFPGKLTWLGISVQSWLMVAMYLFSIGVALLAAWVLSKTVLAAEPTTLILELPPYRLPRLTDVFRMMLRRAQAFLSGAGTVILGCSIVLWALLNFPRPEPAELAGLDADQQRAVALADSYGGRLGHAIEPVFAPLGFDWKIDVGIIGAFAAREVFVATLGVVYSAGEEVDEQDQTLRDRLRAEEKPDGSPKYSPLMGLSLMIFFALACQCMSTLAVVKRETHGYRWPIFLFAYMTTLAWVTSFLVYQGGRLLGFG